MRAYQYNLVDELIVDNFAGGGGANCPYRKQRLPVMAEVLVRANLPELCGKKIKTLAQLDKVLTA